MKKKILLTTIPILIIFILSFTLSVCYIINLKTDISSNILRLHIIGASDEKHDQELKLCVRDRILSDFSTVFSDCSNIEETKKNAESKLKEIEESANDELQKHGCNKSVKAELKVCRFPTKTYDNITLPGGIYNALNIKIGDAKGHNWWCVLYPPLCITENSISIPEKSKEKLKECLTEEEYNLITQSQNSNIKIKFKLAEIIGKYLY